MTAIGLAGIVIGIVGFYHYFTFIDSSAIYKGWVLICIALYRVIAVLAGIAALVPSD